MPDDVWAALVIFLKMVGVVILIDICLGLLLWRIDSHNRARTRRRRQRAERAKKKNDLWFDNYENGDFHRGLARPHAETREGGDGQLAVDLNKHRRYRDHHDRHSHR